MLNGEYCSKCGQRMQLRRLTMGALFHDVLHDLSDLDSRVWRTLIALLLKPGKLTNEFIAGRRTFYLPPFRLYLVLSLVFFLLPLRRRPERSGDRRAERDFRAGQRRGQRRRCAT